MAIKYKKIMGIRSKIKPDPLTEIELSTISEGEDYIDSVIKDQFSKGSHNTIYIDLCVANFMYSMTTKSRTKIPDDRRMLMYKELNRRYNKAGWDTTVEIAQEANFESDHWVLKGKN